MSEQKHHTVSGLLLAPSSVHRRIAALAEQRFVMDQLFPPPVLGRGQRLRRRISAPIGRARQRLADWIAP
jgi:hypothetical protein